MGEVRFLSNLKNREFAFLNICDGTEHATIQENREKREGLSATLLELYGDGLLTVSHFFDEFSRS